ncbi:MAG TPA: glycosyltransferase [Caulobacteraceae bacterium]|jgi:glycosyltransferase involved in cell wall biosynthesis|nr:glycosyltransferase [Caulobacteraceae bacterium]
MTDRSAPAPKVSVSVMTYNQHRFIGECLDSILEQETDFPVEIIVADDASTDGTREIVDRYAREHPDRLRAILHPSNVGVTANYLSAHQAATAEYVAHMDGDDVMLPGKLQAQADFLDRHPNCALVGANSIAFSTAPDGSHRFEGYTSAERYPEVSDFDAFVVMNGFMFTHSSKMYRRAASPDMGDYSRLFDVHMHILQAANGDVGYIHAPLLKYRINVGINTGRDPLADHASAVELAEHLGASPAAVACAYARGCFEGALFSLRGGDHAEFRRRIELSRRYAPLPRRKDAVMRNVLYRLRAAPRLSKSLLRLKDGLWRLRMRRGRANAPGVEA